MRLSRRTFVLAALSFAPPLVVPRPALAQPLWPRARYTDAQRKRAIRRALEFLYRTARNPQHFQDYGDDLLWSFYSVSRATADADIKKRAWVMGQERARHWRRLNPRVADDANASDLRSYAYASFAADGLDVRDGRMKADVQAAVARFGPSDFLSYDPLAEAAPADVPETCERCSNSNLRGATRCRSCGRALSMRDPYDVLCDALVISYVGDSYGVTLGRSLADVMQSLQKMRPYPEPDRVSYEKLSSVVYAVTHVIYALNDYGLYRLDPNWLPQEFVYLKQNVHRSIKAEDAELVGEYLDSLKSFGVTYDDPALRAGVEYVMSEQNSDGSWGDGSTGDIYDLYHPTWTAICGLMDYAWRGEGVSFPEALRRATEA